MSAQHTPTPWVHGGSSLVRAPDGTYPIFGPVRDKTGYVFYPRICSVKALGGPIANSNPDEANAAFIVLAVNSHEALLEALRSIQLEADMGNRAYRRAWGIAEAAIEAAEGRST